MAIEFAASSKHFLFTFLKIKSECQKWTTALKVIPKESSLSCSSKCCKVMKHLEKNVFRDTKELKGICQERMRKKVEDN